MAADTFDAQPMNVLRSRHGTFSLQKRHMPERFACGFTATPT
jgi:hypothetical protein